jgi:hypothetical protein
MCLSERALVLGSVALEVTSNELELCKTELEGKSCVTVYSLCHC